MRRGGAAAIGLLLLAGVGVTAPAAATAEATAHRTTRVASDPAAEPGTFRPVQTWRLLDTRSGLGAPRHALGPAGTVDLTVTGRAGIPATGIAAVVINLTALSSTGRGYITAYAQGTSRPATSNLNYLRAQTRANLAVVPVSAGGAISLYNGSSGTVELLGDVEGYYLAGTGTTAGSFTSLTPTRLLDTRIGTGAPRGSIPAAGDVTFQVAGVGNVPSTGASSVVLNLTATAPTATGYLTAYASGTTRPSVSNLNFASGQTTPNLAIVRIGTNGRVVLHNGSSGHTDFLADVAGYLTAGTGTAVGSYVPITPKRVIDSRAGVGSPRKPLPGGYELVSSVGLPANATAAVLNLTATGATRTGFLAAPPQFPQYSGGGTEPVRGTRTSTLSYAPGQTVANLVLMPLRRGQSLIYNGGGGSVHVIADVVGYTLAPIVTWSAPTKVATYGVLDVSCTSSTFCAEVDSSDNASVYNGATWTKTASVAGDVDAHHGSISCVTTTFCVGAHLGALGVIAFTYDGSTWSTPTNLDTTISSDAEDGVSVSCATTTFCLAGWHGVRAFDGSTWGPLIAPPGLGSISGLSCTSPTFCMAVDRTAHASTFNGTSWSTARSLVAAPTVEALYGLSCTSPVFCLAASYYGSYTWDGTQWNVVNPASADPGHQVQVLDVSCASATFCLGASETTDYTVFTGAAWTTTTSTANGAWAVSCPTEHFCALADNRGYVLLGTA